MMRPFYPLPDFLSIFRRAVAEDDEITIRECEQNYKCGDDGAFRVKGDGDETE